MAQLLSNFNHMVMSLCFILLCKQMIEASINVEHKVKNIDGVGGAGSKAARGNRPPEISTIADLDTTTNGSITDIVTTTTGIYYLFQND